MCGTATWEELEAARDGASVGTLLDRFEHRAARPSAARQAMKLALAQAYAHPAHARLRARAERVYAMYAGATSA